ncbi:MAG: hypothetical protein IKP10_05790 [Clostridia bacterium]|nr:hypothetical protein [Clostridia bacterium]
MAITVWRQEPDGRWTPIGCVDSMTEVPAVILQDRDQIDWEAGYYAGREDDPPA